jgi:hypothetical protein
MCSKIVDREQMAAPQLGGWREGVHMLYIYAYAA